MDETSEKEEKPIELESLTGMKNFLQQSFDISSGNGECLICCSLI